MLVCVLLLALRVPSAGELLQKSADAYQALQSYADEAVVVSELRVPGASTTVIERHKVVTAYGRPRNFLFAFNRDPRVGPEQFVIWCDGGDFQSYWSATKVHEVYSGGRGTLAFALGALPTKGSALLIAPLLFPQAKMHGALVDLQSPRLEGTEMIDGELCYRIAGESKSGVGGATEPVIIWIDQKSLLVRRVLEDTPAGQGADTVKRTITTFKPVANPDLRAARFQYRPPK